ncbi:MAG: hypothetical protein Q4A74_08755 [Cardiobacteriaceae bacterium]|nr:hypothetical protein [Cardiobacteriaceae bacterium]
MNDPFSSEEQYSLWFYPDDRASLGAVIPSSTSKANIMRLLQDGIKYQRPTYDSIPLGDTILQPINVP